LFYLGSGALLIGALSLRCPDTQIVRWIARVGAFSYSIYLWHMPVHDWATPMVEGLIGGPVSWGPYAGVYLVGALGVGMAAAKGIEYPVLLVRDRLFPSRLSVADAR
jgi:peptidoglycan/LPS O-acetylase OafA/YrhL